LGEEAKVGEEEWGGVGGGLRVQGVGGDYIVKVFEEVQLHQVCV